MIRGHRLACALVTSALSACATHPPFATTWYLIEYDDASSSGKVTQPTNISDPAAKEAPRFTDFKTGMYVALVNQTLVPQRISKVSVNPTRDDIGAAWSWTPNDGTETELSPGQVLVLHDTDLFRMMNDGLRPLSTFPCELPVAIVVTTNTGDKVNLRPMGTLPSALPARWTDCTTNRYRSAKSPVTKDPARQ